ncbi:hypothetical protein AAI421_21320 [Rhodococcus aetherivorans]|uniref:hypothetical protein n=1 Tax=Rhodococcus aetherivorans TaxID=191292 RepID=UPI0031E087D5
MNENETTSIATESIESTGVTAAPGATETAQTEPNADPEPNGNAEAAKYRKQLRAAEKDRDAALAQVDTLRRSIIERLIEQDHRVKPAAVWANGTTVADLLGKDGTVDPAAVAAAVTSAEQNLGVLRPPVGVYVPNEGKTPTVLPTTTSWAKLLNPHSRG